MAVIQVVVQLKEQASLPTERRLPLHAQLQSQGVGLGEVHPKLPPGQQVGVGAHRLQGHIPIGAVQRHSQLQGQLVLV